MGQNIDKYLRTKSDKDIILWDKKNTWAVINLHKYRKWWFKNIMLFKVGKTLGEVIF